MQIIYLRYSVLWKSILRYSRSKSTFTSTALTVVLMPLLDRQGEVLLVFDDQYLHQRYLAYCTLPVKGRQPVKWIFTV